MMNSVNRCDMREGDLLPWPISPGSLDQVNVDNLGNVKMKYIQNYNKRIFVFAFLSPLMKSYHLA